jgi:hypothetical protein
MPELGIEPRLKGAVVGFSSRGTIWEEMASLVVNVTEFEIRTGNPHRLLSIYPRMDIPLARLTEDSVCIRLPGGDSAEEIKGRCNFCGYVNMWPVLPWVAFLGDSHYLRLVKGEVFDFRVVERYGISHHIPEKKGLKRAVEEQIDLLDILAERRSIPRRLWRTRRNNLLQYLLGDG